MLASFIVLAIVLVIANIISSLAIGILTSSLGNAIIFCIVVYFLGKKLGLDKTLKSKFSKK